MTERTRLISYLIYGIFSAILNKNTERNFPHPLARTTAFFVAHTKEVCVCLFNFLSVIENIVVLFSVVFAHAHVVLLTTQKSRRARQKIHNARSLHENNARSAANQSARTIVAIK